MSEFAESVPAFLAGAEPKTYGIIVPGLAVIGSASGSGELAGGTKDKHEDPSQGNQVDTDRYRLPFHPHTGQKAGANESGRRRIADNLCAHPDDAGGRRDLQSLVRRLSFKQDRVALVHECRSSVVVCY